MLTDAAVFSLPGQLAEIVKSVFETMLGLDISADGAAWFASADRLTSAVHLSGDWNGTVLLECDCRQACRFAARFLAMDAPEMVDDVVRDVMGELANMIGGNLKCVLTTGIRLSMPSVVDGCDYNLRVCGAEIQERLCLRCDEGDFWITVLSTRS